MPLRIIGGKHRSRKLQALPGLTTRPTRSMVREAAFNLLAGNVQDAQILDLFAGSGALGLEAISRGAKAAVFCDKDRKAIQVVKDNAQALGEYDNCRFLQMDWQAALLQLENKAQFDLVFLDPPYGMDIEQVLAALARHDLLAPGAMLLVEAGTDHLPGFPPGYDMVKQRSYGQSTLTVLQWEGTT